MIMAEFSIVPIGKGESLSKHVARAVKRVMESGLEYRVNPMGTVVEGGWDEVFSVIGEAFRVVMEDCDRATCTVKVDCRKTGGSRLQSKIDSVEDKLGKPVNR